MAAVRCPKCGTLNPDAHRRGVRCSACRESFGKCRYCQFYDSRIVDCTNINRPEHERIIDADEVMNCPEFASVLAPHQPRRAWYAVGRTFAIATVLTLAAALAAIHFVRGPKRVPLLLPVHVSISAPETVMQDEGLDVAATVFNPTDRPAQGVEILITGKGMAGLTCQYVRPPEAFLEAGPRSVSATFGEVPAGEQTSILFHFLTKRTGEVSLVASITVANHSGSTVETVQSEIVP